MASSAGQAGNPNSMDRPYKSVPTGPAEFGLPEGTLLSGGMMLYATVVHLPSQADPTVAEPWPALLFKFATPEPPAEAHHPPILLVCRDEDMAKLRPLIQGAIADARRAASIASPPTYADTAEQPPGAPT